MHAVLHTFRLALVELWIPRLDLGLMHHVDFLPAELPHAFQELVPKLLSLSTRPVQLKACSKSSFGHRPIRTGMADLRIAH